MLIGVYNGDDKITKLRIITVSNLSTMLWCYDDQIIVLQGLDIYNEGTADTLRDLGWALRATIIIRTPWPLHICRPKTNI